MKKPKVPGSNDVAAFLLNGIPLPPESKIQSQEPASLHLGLASRIKRRHLPSGGSDVQENSLQNPPKHDTGKGIIDAICISPNNNPKTR